MAWIAATVTGSKMYVMIDQYAYSRDLKQFTSYVTGVYLIGSTKEWFTQSYVLYNQTIVERGKNGDKSHVRITFSDITSVLVKLVLSMLLC